MLEQDFRKFFDQRSEFTLKDEHAGAGMIENGGQLGGLQPHVERHRDGSHQRRPVVAFQELMIVEAEIGDAVAGPNALAKVARRQGVRNAHRTGRR